MKDNNSIPVPQPSIQQESTSPIEPKPKTNTTPFFIVLIILLMGIIGYLLYQNYQLKKQISTFQPTPTTSTVAHSTSTPNPTLNWNTFTSVNKDYSFKYPNSIGWEVRIKGDETGSLARKNNGEVVCHILDTTTSEGIPVYKSCTGFNIESFGISLSNEKTLDEHIKNSTLYQDKTKIKFNNIDAVQSYYYGSVQAPTCRETFFIYKNQGFNLDECYVREDYNHVTTPSELPPANPDILSTFEFLQ